MTHEDKTSLCDKIRSCGWEQGSLFLSSPSDLGVGKSKKKILYLLITHSCDVVRVSFKDEPYAEAIPAKAIDSAQGNLTYGKNPRKIHIELYYRKKQKWYEFSISEKVSFPREKLTKIKPSSAYKISNEYIRMISTLVAKKYDRAAFPDAFNDRINGSGIKKKIADILKSVGREILGLYIRLNSYEELPQDQPYKIMLYMLLSDNAKNVDIDFQKMLDKIVEKIEGTSAIQVLPNCALLTQDEMTVRDIVTMDRWDFDYLSNREKPGGDVIKRR